MADKKANALAIDESPATTSTDSDAGLPSPAEVKARLEGIRDRLATHTRNHPGGAHGTIADETVKDLEALIEQLHS